MAKINSPSLITERLQLRQPEDNDASALYLLRSDQRVNKYIYRPESSSITETRAFIFTINKQVKHGELLYWTICFLDKPELIGTICLWNFSEDRKTAELGYELYPDYQAQGLMNEAVKSVISYGLNDLGLSSIEACVHKHNKSSIKLLEKHGFKPENDIADKKTADYITYTLTNE